MDQAGYTLETERVSSGIPVLDKALDSGLWPEDQRSSRVHPARARPDGLHYIFKGAEMGRPGLIAGLQENPTQPERIVNGFAVARPATTCT